MLTLVRRCSISKGDLLVMGLPLPMRRCDSACLFSFELQPFICVNSTVTSPVPPLPPAPSHASLQWWLTACFDRFLQHARFSRGPFPRVCPRWRAVDKPLSRAFFPAAHHHPSRTIFQAGYTSWCTSRDLPPPPTLSVPLLLIDERLSSSAAAAALGSAAAAVAASHARPPRPNTKRPTPGRQRVEHHYSAAAAAAKASADRVASIDAASAVWILEAAVMAITGRRGVLSSSQT